jgi:hypothetical protein
MPRGVRGSTASASPTLTILRQAPRLCIRKLCVRAEERFKLGGCLPRKAAPLGHDPICQAGPHRLFETEGNWPHNDSTEVTILGSR